MFSDNTWLDTLTRMTMSEVSKAAHDTEQFYLFIVMREGFTDKTPETPEWIKR